VRAITADAFDMDAWRAAWESGYETANTLSLQQAKESIAKQPALYAELLGPCTDAYLRGDFEMFGFKTTRGAWLVSLVLCHYSAYRMQLFLYLKSSGREELSTMNLWAGVDPK
jgi:hypothetical protein